GFQRCPLRIGVGGAVPPLPPGAGPPRWSRTRAGCRHRPCRIGSPAPAGPVRHWRPDRAAPLRPPLRRIDIRLIFYSATVARHWQGTPWWWRLVASYLIVDPSVAVGLSGYPRLSRDPAPAYHL